MNVETVGPKVIGVFERVVGETPPRGLATLPRDVAAWTSLAQIKLVYQLEAEFGVHLPDRFLLPAAALADLAAVVCEQL